MVSMFGGLRIGEILALKWRDVDTESKTIRIDNALTHQVTFDYDGNVKSRQSIISDTKTVASVREIPIPNILAKALDEWKTIRWLQGNILSKKYKKPISFIMPNELVFGTERENKLRTYYGTRAIFNRFLKVNQLSEYGIHFHTLRHTFSNMLFEFGENPKVIQMLMGHKDVMTTLRNYNSVDRSYLRQATNKLDEIIEKPEMELE